MEIFNELLGQLITTLSGAAFIGLSTLCGFYVKKLINSVQKRDLEGEIRKYVLWAEQAPSFKAYTGEKKYKAVNDKIEKYCGNNNISLTEDEQMIYIESTVAKMNLTTGLKLIKPAELDEQECEQEFIVLSKG